MCQSCDKLQIGKIIQADIPEHSDVFMDDGVPVFQADSEFFAWIDNRFVHGVLDGGKGLIGEEFHMDAALS